MRWLNRLLGRERSYTTRRIAAITEHDTWVELEGEVEALTLLRDPLDGQDAVLLDYRARRPGLARRYFGVHDVGATIEGQQGTNFVLRDASGSALIEVEPGGDIGQLHRRLLAEFGVDLLADSDRVSPGDRIRVRGRVRVQSRDSSPHRRDPWSVTVVLDDVEVGALEI